MSDSETFRGRRWKGARLAGEPWRSEFSEERRLPPRCEVRWSAGRWRGWLGQSVWLVSGLANSFPNGRLGGLGRPPHLRSCPRPACRYGRTVPGVQETPRKTSPKTDGAILRLL